MKEVLLLGLPLVAPPIVEALSNLFKQASADQKARNEFIKALEQQKIAAWRGISSYVLYDWSTEEIIPPDKINEALLRKASTSVYVNKWALESNPGPLLSPEKLPPDELPAYMLYTGKLKDLNRYTGSAARRTIQPNFER
jgi:hypothetical protein